MRSTEELTKSTNTITQSYTRTADQIGKLTQAGQEYVDQLEKMNKKLSSLNKVYGNMLTAMNTKEEV
jgi:uncharacterized protein YukE